jgi:hypothetical protein
MNDLAPIPDTPLIRRRLAENVRAAKLLRSQLKLSIRADEERRRRRTEDGAGPPSVDRREADRWA